MMHDTFLLICIQVQQAAACLTCDLCAGALSCKSNGTRVNFLWHFSSSLFFVWDMLFAKFVKHIVSQHYIFSIPENSACYIASWCLVGLGELACWHCILCCLVLWSWSHQLLLYAPHKQIPVHLHELFFIAVVLLLSVWWWRWYLYYNKCCIQNTYSTVQRHIVENKTNIYHNLCMFT